MRWYKTSMKRDTPGLAENGSTRSRTAEMVAYEEERWRNYNCQDK